MAVLRIEPTSTPRRHIDWPSIGIIATAVVVVTALSLAASKGRDIAREKDADRLADRVIERLQERGLIPK